MSANGRILFYNWRVFPLQPPRPGPSLCWRSNPQVWAFSAAFQKPLGELNTSTSVHVTVRLSGHEPCRGGTGAGSQMAWLQGEVTALPEGALIYLRTTNGKESEMLGSHENVFSA